MKTSKGDIVELEDGTVFVVIEVLEENGKEIYCLLSEDMTQLGFCNVIKQEDDTYAWEFIEDMDEITTITEKFVPLIDATIAGLAEQGYVAELEEIVAKIEEQGLLSEAPAVGGA